MIIASHPSFSNNNSITDEYKFLFIRPPPSRLLCNFLPAPLERRFFMQNFNTESYFRELDTYLDLRDLSINTRRNYHSSLKAYLTWLSGTLAVSPERSEEHTSELQSRPHLVCRLLLEKKKPHRSRC